MFNLNEAAIFQAVKWERHLAFRFASFGKRLFFVLFVLTSLLFIFFWAPQFFGLLIIFLVLTLTFWLKESFLNSKLKNPKLKVKIEEVIRRPEEYNLAEFLSFEVAKAVDKSIKFAQSKKISHISSTILFYNLLRDIPKLNFIFSRALLHLKTLKTTLEMYFKNLTNYPGGEKFKFSYSTDFQSTILESLKVAQKKGHQRIEIGDLLTA